VGNNFPNFLFNCKQMCASESENALNYKICNVIVILSKRFLKGNFKGLIPTCQKKLSFAQIFWVKIVVMFGSTYACEKFSPYEQ